MLVGVGAGHVGQHPGITGVGLGARHPDPVPVAVHRQRVHRQHPIAHPHQGPHEQAPVGLDPDHHLDLVVLDTLGHC